MSDRRPLVQIFLFGMLGPIVAKVVIWQHGFRSLGITKRSKASKYMKRRRGIIQRHSYYAIAQSCGVIGLGNVRTMLSFLLGVAVYAILYSLYHYPVPTISAMMIVGGFACIRYPVPLPHPFSRITINPYYLITAGAWGFFGWLVMAGIVHKFLQLVGAM